MKYSYIITHRSSDNYRHINLLSIIKWLEPFNDVIEIIVVEQDSEPKIEKYLPKNIKYIFAYNPGLFHKTWGFNIGANYSTTNNLIFGDNDIILKRYEFKFYLDEVENNEFCTPYKYFVVKLNEHETINITNDLDNISLPIGKRVPNTLGIITGGLFSIKRDIFFKIGGADENFRGWGAEDDAFREKLYKFNVKVKILEYIAYHLYHPETGGKGNSEYIKNNYKNNCDILRSIKKMNIIELQEYINKNKELGNLNKYKI